MAGGSLNVSIVFVGYGAARVLALQTTSSAFDFLSRRKSLGRLTLRRRAQVNLCLRRNC
jgi:hypothetical protein